MPLTIDWSVTIDGINATSRFNPYVMELEVQDQAGTTSDTARITLADDGRIIMPRKGAMMRVIIMGEPVFEGKTESPRFSFAKGDGGRLILSAKGFDAEKGAKEGRHFAKEDATLEEYLKDFAKRAGLSEIKIDPALAKIKRPWWGPEGRDFLHEGQRLSRELGATFKIQGNKAVLAKRGKGMTPSGQSLPTIYATNPGNLLNVDIEPTDAREVFRDVRVGGFDRKSAKFFEEKVDIEGGSSGGASSVIRGKRADKDDAKTRGEGRKAEAERDKGGGTIEIDIEPRARAEGTCILQGARAGIDGTYRISGATHTLRPGDSGGSTTKLEVKQPDDKAGQDTRKTGDTENK
ncbi:phage late control D family protein [Methylobacterium planeticum]|uniref:Late control D family protein n=1 Tax=Methylobacterium planeticum TaxID=2615211 RepID=A0A6N6MIF2_9HYPH|nr:late control D family protein [Methylobacterium planeticum]KAB1069273.1 late control D family protein [Methylobacterium planeticum]